MIKPYEALMFVAAAAVAYLIMSKTAKAAAPVATSSRYDGVTLGSEQARMLAEQDAGLW